MPLVPSTPTPIKRTSPASGLGAFGDALSIPLLLMMKTSVTGCRMTPGLSVGSSARTSRAALTSVLLWVGMLLAPRAEAAPPGYALAWSDEFDGTALDTTKWGYRQLGVRNDATNVTTAVSVGGGNLKITTYTDNGTHYTGMISTDTKYMPLYGYMEARIQFSDSPGEWSAFWLQSPTMSTVGDPHTNGIEMDVVEHRARDSGNTDISNQAVSNLHWDGYGVDHKSVGSGLRGSGLATGFHTYAVEWTPDVQRYYIDGAYLYSVANSTDTDPVPPLAPSSHRSEYFILSSEVHTGSWAGNIPTGGYGSLATSTTVMTVDYVRCYQLSVPTAPTGLSATPGSAQVALAWTGSAGATSYAVKRATTSGGPYTTVAPGVTGASYTDTGLSNGTTYYYVVSALNFQGESPNTAQVSAKPPGTLTLAPTDDAYVRDGTYATTNFGSATTLTVKSDATSYKRNAHLKFDLTPVATVSAATLRLYVSSVNSDATRTISIYSATTAGWTEGAVTWNTAPGLLNLVTTFTVSNTPGTWYGVDITGYIQGKKAAGVNNISFVLTNTGATSSTNDVSFASKEATTGDPQLVVVP